MKSSHVFRFAIALGSTLFFSYAPFPTAAQTITPFNDGTGTVVTPEGNRFNIEGGTLSGDRANLFHSFQQFGLDANQIANFLSGPQIQNILARVSGGEASVINGLIQVTGGASNLYLLNPSGIVFGSGARLDVPAAFTATTATGIGFGNGHWWNAFGPNNYTNLTGAPTSFAFALSQPGAIANAGGLAVKESQSLNLIGGTVVNTGRLSAPGGQITLAAIPGEKLVRVSQPGSLLSLDLPIAAKADLNTPSFSPLTLPALLTGSGVTEATKITVADGVAKLSDSGTSTALGAGTTIVSGQLDVAQTADASAGSITVLGDRIALLSASLDASGAQGGGTVLIGGDYRGQGTIPKATVTHVSSDSVIKADGLNQSNGGQVIVWADEATRFYGRISARGSGAIGKGGFVEVSSKQNLAFGGSVDVRSAFGRSGTVLIDPRNILIVPGIEEINGDDVRLGADRLAELTGNIRLEATNDIAIAPGISLNLTNADAIEFIADSDGDQVGAFVMSAEDSIVAPGKDVTIQGASVSLGTINTGGDVAKAGDIRLTATSGDLNTQELIAQSLAGEVAPEDVAGGAVILKSNSGNIKVGDINTKTTFFQGGGAVQITAGGNVEVGDVDTDGGALAIEGASITTASIDALGFANNILDSGAVTLVSKTGDISVQTIRSGGGGIDIDAAGRFRALSYFSFNGLEETLLKLKDSPELIAFFKEKLITPDLSPAEAEDIARVIENSEVTFLIETALPVSLIATSSKAEAIRIQHGGRSLTEVNNGGSIAILGKGNSYDFVVGAIATVVKGEEFIPAEEGISIQDLDLTIDATYPLIRNEKFTPLIVSTESSNTLQDPNALPVDFSGSVGAIIIGDNATNASLRTSIRNRPFDASSGLGSGGGAIAGGEGVGSGNASNSGGGLGSGDGGANSGTGSNSGGAGSGAGSSGRDNSPNLGGETNSNSTSLIASRGSGANGEAAQPQLTTENQEPNCRLRENNKKSDKCKKILNVGDNVAPGSRFEPRQNP